MLAIVIPAALRLPRPRRAGERMATGSILLTGYTLAQARRIGMFWILCAALSSSTMLGTALAFHQIALLGARGLPPIEAGANFLPQTVTALLATLLVGALIDRHDPRIFVVLSMIAMAAALVLSAVVSSGWSAIVYGLVPGSSSGAVRGLEAATFARYYGIAHIGAIRGIAMSIGLGASALGPYALALRADLAGGFALPAIALAAIPLSVVVATLIVRPPAEHGAVSAR